MFPQFRKLDNESGIVLFIVLMTAVIIMIFSLSILTQSMNEINYAQQQIDQLTATEWSKGVFWNAESTGNTQSVNVPIILQNRTYDATLSFSSTTNQYSVSTNYDTFQ